MWVSAAQALAQAHKLPWQMLLPVKQKMATADEDTADKLAKDYNTWLQSAALTDVSPASQAAGVLQAAVAHVHAQLHPQAPAAKGC